MIHNGHPGMRILFVTGMLDIEKLESSLPGEILFKPVDLAVLSAKVDELLADSEPAQLAVYSLYNSSPLSLETRAFAALLLP